MYLFIYLYIYLCTHLVDEVQDSFDTKIENLNGIYFSRVRWVSPKMGHVGPIEGPLP